MQIDSIELKCLLASKGVKVAKEIYKTFSRNYRLSVNPLMCNCLILSDRTKGKALPMAVSPTDVA